MPRSGYALHSSHSRRQPSPKIKFGREAVTQGGLRLLPQPTPREQFLPPDSIMRLVASQVAAAKHASNRIRRFDSALRTYCAMALGGYSIAAVSRSTCTGS